MRADKLRELGSGIFRQSLYPYKPKERKHSIIFGLDTEFTNEAEPRLLTWQISLDKEHTYIYKPEEKEYSWESIYQVSKYIIKDCNLRLSDYSMIVYAVYYSVAELQHLDWQESNLHIMSTHQANAKKRISKNRYLYFFDVGSWYPGQSLKDVATIFGLEKLKYDVTDLTNKDLKCHAFQEYAKNDAYITGEILRRMRTLELKNSNIDILLMKTPASTSGADFRSKYVKEKHGQPHTTMRKRGLWASNGGRKEAFFRGELDNVYEYDAKSFYPNSCIQLGLLPLENDWHYAESLDQLLNAKGGFGTFMFEYPKTETYPCLPVYSNDKYPRVYYVLKGTSDCTSFEAKVAQDQGARLVLLRGWYYNSGVDWLADYLRNLIEQRAKTNDLAESTLLKLKANSIIGKLAQKRLSYDVNELLAYSKKENIPIEVVSSIKGLPIKKKLSTGNLFYPEWNMLILGKARAIIGKLAKEVEALQIATDAVFTTRQNLGDRFTYEGIEFELKNVGSYKCYREGLYQHNDNVRYHGASYEIAKKAFDNFKPDTELNYQNSRITSIKQSMNSGKKLGSRHIQDFKLDLHYDNKRELLDNGFTRPWVSEETIPQSEPPEIMSFGNHPAFDYFMDGDNK